MKTTLFYIFWISLICYFISMWEVIWTAFNKLRYIMTSSGYLIQLTPKEQWAIFATLMALVCGVCHLIEVYDNMSVRSQNLYDTEMNSRIGKWGSK